MAERAPGEVRRGASPGSCPVEAGAAGGAGSRQGYTSGPVAPAVACVSFVYRRRISGGWEAGGMRPDAGDEGSAGLYAAGRAGAGLDGVGDGAGAERVSAMRRRVHSGRLPTNIGAG